MMTSRKSTHVLVAQFFFVLILIGNFAFWNHSRHVLPEWDNVPVPPKISMASFIGLGDKIISYRLYAYMLQNFGNTGGRFESLKKYDYGHLEDWFFLTDEIDPISNYVPFMASYFFGAVEGDKEKTRHVVNYLAKHGEQPYPEKWRWLAQAVYLARYKMEDMNLALSLAYKVNALPGYVAPWARQLPAFVQLKMGNKEAAYEIMVRMLASDGAKLHPNEVNAMKDFICTRTLDKAALAKNPLCQDLK